MKDASEVQYELTVLDTIRNLDYFRKNEETLAQSHSDYYVKGLQVGSAHTKKELILAATFREYSVIKRSNHRDQLAAFVYGKEAGLLQPLNDIQLEKIV